MKDESTKITIAEVGGTVAKAVGIMAILVSVVWYSMNAIMYRDYHPIRLYKAEQSNISIRRQQDQAAFDKLRREEERYDEFVGQLFGENGLADRNNDKFYSFEELVDAYRRMGTRFDKTYYANGNWHQGWTFRGNEFPIPHTQGFWLNHQEFPTASELETAIQSFLAEQTQR